MFRGVGTALITPFQSDGTLDEAALTRFVDWQSTEGVNFLVPCGTTGENPTLSADEHRRVVELTVLAANGRVPVLAGAGSNSTARAVALAVEAVDLGQEQVVGAPDWRELDHAGFDQLLNAGASSRTYMFGRTPQP